ncbi:MAG: CHAT domain-containing protein [Bacteroidia bacterium]|nr:CHAT domain-containing protein [Bacteroidia bacterium]
MYNENAYSAAVFPLEKAWELDDDPEPVDLTPYMQKKIPLIYSYSQAAMFSKLKVALDKTRKNFIEYARKNPGVSVMARHDFFYGRYYDHLGDLPKARSYFLSALNGYEVAYNFNPNSFYLESQADCYQALGIILKDLGDFNAAIESYQNESVFLGRAGYAPKNKRFASLENNMGVAFEEMGQFDKSLQMYMSAKDKYLASLGLNHEKTAASLINIGSVYHQLGQYSDALAQYNTALSIYQTIYAVNPDHSDFPIVYRNMANSFLEMGDMENADLYFQKALTGFERKFGENHYEVAVTRTDIARLHQKSNHIDQALEMIQKAIFSLDKEYQSSNLAAQPHLEQVAFLRDLLAAQKLKTSLLENKYHATGEISNLKIALETYQSMAELIRKLRQGMQVEESKLFLSGQAVPIFEDAIGLCMLLNQLTQDPGFLERGFGFAEQSKAMVLLESMKIKELQESIDPELHRIQDELRMFYLDFERRVKENSSVKNQGEYQKQLDELRLRINASERKMQEDFPAFYNLNYEVNTISPEKIRQRILNQDKVLVEYFLGEENLFIFLLTHENLTVKQIKIDKDFPNHILGMKNALEGLQIPVEATRKPYRDEAWYLYQKVFEPIAKDIGDRQVIIIPDGLLGYIPFEALLTQQTDSKDFRDFPYLILQSNYNFSYDYSATLLWENAVNRARHRARDYVGFTPSFSAHHNELPAIRKSIEEIRDLSGGVLFQDAEAFSYKFRFSDFKDKIVHLGTHAYINDSIPLFSQIMFAADPANPSDTALYTYQLFNMKMGASLVILSACQTGDGKLMRGEGIMSLSRGFTFAGCPSILMSLWKVASAHRSTADINLGFFTRMRAGMPKNEALYQSKREYLATLKYCEEANPFLWAEMILSGDPAPIYHPNHLGYGFAGIWALGVIIALYRRKKRKKTSVAD